MTNHEVDFHKILILIYLNNHEFVLDINDLLELVGMNYNLVRQSISELIREGFINRNQDVRAYRLTSLGKKFLSDKYLDNILLEDLKSTVDGPDPTRLFHIFVPKNFKKRLK
ncbi:DUF4364 family protein [Paenibacillus sp. 481]|uniref:DUF4364 family protein n=1 Tax=Paenibacillus sp. 481 TaxID=2835869 RepID=UPI001E4943EB|nr:DUF4364 family protein [Paenibacillus sp. 481]UHA74699.1 hypothetical protein KIK04_06395 [Paenibacillus sp. 481]